MKNVGNDDLGDVDFGATGTLFPANLNNGKKFVTELHIISATISIRCFI